MARREDEIAAFHHRIRARSRDASQMAALFLSCGVDLHTALQLSGNDRARLVRRLRRLVERERLKGLRHHWSYDINRHIVLAQVLRRLTSDAKPNSLHGDRVRPARKTPRADHAAF